MNSNADTDIFARLAICTGAHALSAPALLRRRARVVQKGLTRGGQGDRVVQMKRHVRIVLLSKNRTILLNSVCDFEERICWHETSIALLPAPRTQAQLLLFNSFLPP